MAQLPSNNSQSRPRLLFVVTVSWYFISHRLVLAKAAREAGYDVHVATRITSRDDAALITDAGLSLHPLEIGRGDSSLVYDLRSIWKLISLYRQVRPGIIHQVAMKPVVFGGIAARFVRTAAVVQAIPGMGYVFTAHGPMARLRRAMLTVALKIACRQRDTIAIVQNNTDRDALIDARIISANRIKLVSGSGVDTQLFLPVPESSTPIRVVLPGRILREKGVVEFCQAAGSLRATGIDAHFVLAGMLDASNPGALSAKDVETITKANGVEYLGHVKDIRELFATCHIVCLPSYREGLPKALIEAAAVGRPIVTTDCPGCRDVVRDGLNGLLVPVGDSIALAAALRRLILDPGARIRMGKAGRRIVEEEYELGSVISRTLSIYDELSEMLPK